ncbi:MAG: hypothetical protein AAGB46_00190 [Verrucomicrobiota bacterium]
MLDEIIVSEFLEANGFFVRSMRRTRSQSKRTTKEEGVELYAKNMYFKPGGREASFLLFPSELRYVESMIVCIRGWYGDKAALASMTGSADMQKYVESNILKNVDKWFEVEETDWVDGEDPKRVLVAPVIPTQDPHRRQIAALLREKGVYGILSYKTMLLDIIDRVDTRKVYPKSELLQLIRVLKTFDLVKDSQMNFLG